MSKQHHNRIQIVVMDTIEVKDKDHSPRLVVLSQQCIDITAMIHRFLYIIMEESRPIREQITSGGDKTR